MSNPLHNYSLPMLADTFAEVAAEYRGAKARKKAVEEELARRGVVRCVGERYEIKRSKFDRMDPDRDALKAELGERWSEFQKVVPITRWTATEVARRAA